MHIIEDKMTGVHTVVHVANNAVYSMIIKPNHAIKSLKRNQEFLSIFSIPPDIYNLMYEAYKEFVIARDGKWISPFDSSFSVPS